MNFFKTIKNDPFRKTYFQILIEIGFLSIQNKSISRSKRIYRDYLLYKKANKNIFHFRYPSDLVKKRNEFNWKNGKDEILNDKIKFNFYLRENNIPTTNYIGSIRKNIFNDSDSQIVLENSEDLIPILSQKLEIHQSLFIKRIDTYGGSDIFKINKKNLSTIKNINLEYDYLIDETIEQHNKLNEINPNCINTLRVNTFRNLNGEIIICNCQLRLGVGDAWVDNSTAGGITLIYDIDANKLNKRAYSLYRQGGKTFLQHPSTKFVFENKSLPFSEDIKLLVKKTALLFDTPIIGWDIAYTKNGPIVIEGNDNPSVMLMQVPEKGIIEREIFREIFKKQ